MHFKNTTILAAICATALSTGAIAQSSNGNADVGVDAGASGSGVSADVQADAGMSGEANGSSNGKATGGGVAGGSMTAGAGMSDDAGGSGKAMGSGSAGGSMTAGKSDDSMGAAGEGSGGTYGQLIANLRTNSQGDTAQALADLDADADVETVTLAELRGEAAENAGALDQAMADMQDEMSEIRSDISANAELSSALEAEGYTAEDVVAANVATDGSVTLVVDDAS